MAGARQLASALAIPGGAQWRAKGDQHRSYRFAEANKDEPYRLYVPTNWDGQAKLPLVMFLHGSGADESTYIDANNKQMLTLAQQRGYILVAPLGDAGAYGNFLRLSSPFGKPDEAAKLIAQITPDSERTNELSEKDVINVLELILAEYPVDRAAMFLTGHSMGSGGTWYIGGKYASYWKGLRAHVGPVRTGDGLPWESVRPIYLFVTEGTQRRRWKEAGLCGLADTKSVHVGIRGSERRPRRDGEAGVARCLRLLRPHAVEVTRCPPSPKRDTFVEEECGSSPRGSWPTTAGIDPGMARPSRFLGIVGFSLFTALMLVAGCGSPAPGGGSADRRCRGYDIHGRRHGTEWQRGRWRRRYRGRRQRGHRWQLQLRRHHGRGR